MNVYTFTDKVGLMCVCQQGVVLPTHLGDELLK